MYIILVYIVFLLPVWLESAEQNNDTPVPRQQDSPQNLPKAYKKSVQYVHDIQKWNTEKGFFL